MLHNNEPAMWTMFTASFLEFVFFCTETEEMRFGSLPDGHIHQQSIWEGYRTTCKEYSEEPTAETGFCSGEAFPYTTRRSVALVFETDNVAT